MGRFPIGVIIDSFRTDTVTAVKKAACVGADGIQVYATRGEMAPENMNAQKRADFRNLVSDNGLVISALCGDLGCGFANKERNPELIEKSKRILDLAKELGTDVVTTHIGVVPADKSVDRYKIMQEACAELAQYADSVKAHFAIETGPETSAVLKEFLDSLDSTGVAHAKDGRQLFYKDPEIVYGVRNDPLVTGPSFEEVPLGEGSVDWNKYLAALEDIGFKGFLTIEREVGDNPEKDIRGAVEFLKNLGCGR